MARSARLLIIVALVAVIGIAAVQATDEAAHGASTSRLSRLAFHGDQFWNYDFTTTLVRSNRVDLSIEAVPSDGFARLLDPATQQLGPLQEVTRHTYRFEALRAGTGQVAILGSSARNEPNAIVDLTVLPPASSRTKTFALVALAAALPLALVGGVLLLRARRRR